MSKIHSIPIRILSIITLAAFCFALRYDIPGMSFAATAATKPLPAFESVGRSRAAFIATQAGPAYALRSEAVTEAPQTAQALGNALGGKVQAVARPSSDSRILAAIEAAKVFSRTRITAAGQAPLATGHASGSLPSLRSGLRWTAQAAGVLVAVVIDADSDSNNRLVRKIKENRQFYDVLSADNGDNAQILMADYHLPQNAEVKFVKIQKSGNSFTLSVEGFDPKIIDLSEDINSAIRDYLQDV